MRTTILAILVLGATGLSAADLPITATWEASADWPYSSREVTVLPDGRLLLMPDSHHTVPQLYDPATSTWTPTATPPAKPPQGRCLLADGRVFFVGDVSIGSGRATMIYDPAVDSWERRADAPVDLRTPNVSLTAADEVYVYGGYKDRTDGNLYDPATDTWRAGPDVDMPHPYTSFNTLFVHPDRSAWILARGEEGRNRAYVFDPARLTLRVNSPIIPSSAGLNTAALVESRVYLLDTERDEHDRYDMTTTLSANDLGDGSLVEVDSWNFPDRRQAEEKIFIFSLPLGGKDWLGRYQTSLADNDPVDGKWDVRLRDAATGTWHDLPQLPVTASTKYMHCYPLPDGLLFVWQDADRQYRHSYRLRLDWTGGTVPVRVVDDIGDLAVDEGATTTFTYHLEGDIPPAGVTVVAERITGGSAPLTVVGGQSQLVRSRSEVKTVRLAALVDGNSDDDTGTIRVRVVQGDGTMDPHARTIAVTVADTVTGGGGPGGHLPGDVNGDGAVNALDLDEVIDHFGTTAE